MNTLKFIFLSFFLLAGASVFSQNSPFRFGVNAGVNMSNAMIGAAETNGSSFKAGHQIGVTVDYALSHKFAVLSGVSFMTKGSTIEDLDYTDYTGSAPDVTHKFGLQYLQIPFYGACKFGLSDGLNLMAGIGPYFAYGTGGKTKVILNKGIWGDGATEREFKTFEKNEEYPWYVELKRFDFGLGALVNLEYRKFNVNIGYDQGLLNIAHKITGYEYRNYGLTFSVGYKY